MANHTLVKAQPTIVMAAVDTEQTVRFRPIRAVNISRRVTRLGPLLRSFRDFIDEVWWGSLWGVLLGCGLGMAAVAVAKEFGRWWGVGALTAAIALWILVVVRLLRAWRAKRVVITPLPEVVPPPHRFDRALVYAAVSGRPLRRPSSLCEKTAIAVVLDRRGQDAPQIARLLGCEPQFAAWLLSFEVPDFAWTAER